ncbi:hypothetical protein ACWIGI_28630 [Nocardia sp. NPDC055321]
MPSDVEHERLIRKTFSQLDRWRAAKAPFEPGSGSQLRGDDEDWPPHPLSQLAHQGLLVAQEHLQAIRAHLDPENGPGQLFPLAHLTLCRTALVGAAQAVWLLAPDQRQERLRRHHLLITDVQANHRVYLEDLRDYVGVCGDENLNLALAHLNTRIGEMEAKRAALNETGRFRNTSMIRDATREAFADRDDRDQLVKAAVLSWRSGSGVAHGFFWPLYGRAGTIRIAGGDDNSGLATAIFGGSAEELAEPYLAAFQLCEKGWRMLRQRGR